MLNTTPAETTSPSDLFGEVIHSYTRAQAIEDGVLIDLSALAPEVCRQHYTAPVACTAAVWAIVDRAVKNPRWMNDVNGVVHDVLWMSRVSGARLDGFTKIFQVIIKGAGRKSTFTFKATMGPDESGTPCFTIILPEED
jgi:hypothetical protein